HTRCLSDWSSDVCSSDLTDSWCAYQVVETLFFTPGHALLTLLLMVFLMAQLDGTLTMLSLAVAPFMVGASFLVGKPLRAAARLRSEERRVGKGWRAGG